MRGWLTRKTDLVAAVRCRLLIWRCQQSQGRWLGVQNPGAPVQQNGLWGPSNPGVLALPACFERMLGHPHELKQCHRRSGCQAPRHVENLTSLGQRRSVFFRVTRIGWRWAAIHMHLQPPFQQRQVPQLAAIDAGEMFWGFGCCQQLVDIIALVKATLETGL